VDSARNHQPLLYAPPSHSNDTRRHGPASIDTLLEAWLLGRSSCGRWLRRLTMQTWREPRADATSDPILDIGTCSSIDKSKSDYVAHMRICVILFEYSCLCRRLCTPRDIDFLYVTFKGTRLLVLFNFPELSCSPEKTTTRVNCDVVCLYDQWRVSWDDGVVTFQSCCTTATTPNPIPHLPPSLHK
jgi:hypothetical protein